MNVVRGINFSVRDENLHAKGGAWSFKYKLRNLNLSNEDKIKLELNIRQSSDLLFQHETEIIKMMFSQGEIKGITAHQLECFVKSRINECLKELGYDKEYDVTYNPISEWFYKGINDYTFNDFFSGLGNQYHRQWNELDFVWKVKELND